MITESKQNRRDRQTFEFLAIKIRTNGIDSDHILLRKTLYYFYYLEIVTAPNSNKKLKTLHSSTTIQEKYHM